MSSTRDLMMAALVPVADFLGKNYPCGCANHPPDDCPGEICEAEEVVRMVLENVAADIWDAGYAACAEDVNHSANWFSHTPNPHRENR